LNLQTIPRKDKVIKRAFVPKLDALLYFDYEGIELRLLAFYMASLGDTSMADVFKGPDPDLHRESAIGIFQLNREPTDAERQLGKNLNFSMVYGGGKPAVMRYLAEFMAPAEPSWKYAGEVLENFHKRWPGIQVVQAVINQKLDDVGYIKTMFGRQLHPESRHKALNALVQGCAADLMRNALVTVDAAISGLDSHLVNVVHDEIQIDAKEEDIPYLVENVPGWMDWPEISKLVPITTECEITRSTWADKEAYLVR